MQLWIPTKHGFFAFCPYLTIWQCWTKSQNHEKVCRLFDDLVAYYAPLDKVKGGCQLLIMKIKGFQKSFAISKCTAFKVYDKMNVRLQPTVIPYLFYENGFNCGTSTVTKLVPSTVPL